MNSVFSIGRYVWIFSRDNNGKQIIKKIDDFYPYFYYDDEEGEYESIFGDRCSKKIVDSPYDVVKERNKYRKTFEADVHYPNRFIIDYFDEISDCPLRYQFIDIECMTKTKALPDVLKPKDPVISICSWDSFDKKYYIFCWRDDIALNAERKKISDIMYCSTEKEMFECFIEFQKMTKPDAWGAWNGDNFDYPYLFNRFGVDSLKECSSIDKAGFNGREYYIAGISLLDMLRMYKHVVAPGGQKESYALDYIGRLELNKGKTERDWSLINEDIWYNKFDEVLEYNRNDVEIMVGLDEKRKIVRYFNTIRRIGKSKFEDLFYNSFVVDNAILSLSKEKFVLPTKEKGKKIKVVGGHVKDPEKGLHYNVADFDASAMYPNFIITFNISPETLDPHGKININGIRFRKEPKGLFPRVCMHFQNTRNELKSEMMQYAVGTEEYESLYLLQSSAKYLNNSVFGQAGFPGSRFYNPDVANTITYLGREFTKWVGKEAESLGYKYLYSDTDSIWLVMNSNDLEECLREGKEFQKLIMTDIDEWVKQFGVEEHTLSLKFESMWKSLYFSTKKRYCGICTWKEGLYCEEEEFKGLEVRRSDFPQIAKKLQKTIMKMIIRGKTKEDVDKIIDNFISNIENVPVQELGFPSGTKQIEAYKSDPIHIRAMKYSMEHNLDIFYPGEKIKYIFVKKVPRGYPKTDVIAFKEIFPTGFKVDYDRVIDRVVWKKIHPLYRNLGWRVDDSRQLKLESQF